MSGGLAPAHASSQGGWFANLMQNPMRNGLRIAALVFLLDQISKVVILDVVDLEAKGSIAVLPFFSLTMVWNKGVSMGLFQAGSDVARWGLVAATGLVAVFVVYWMKKAENRFALLAFALILGGAVGNILDRVRFGAVVDFLHLYAFGYSFYVFNVADSAITVGVIFLLIEAFLSPRGGPKQDAG